MTIVEEYFGLIFQSNEIQIMAAWFLMKRMDNRDGSSMLSLYSAWDHTESFNWLVLILILTLFQFYLR